MPCLIGLVDSVFGEIDLPVPGKPWRVEITRMAHSTRLVLRKHSWAVGLLESRTNPGPATQTHHNAVIATFRQDGFTIGETAHAYALLDSFLYGFAVQEASLPFDSVDEMHDVAGPMLEMVSADEFPYLIEIMTGHVLLPGYDFGDEFEFRPESDPGWTGKPESQAVAQPAIDALDW